MKLTKASCPFCHKKKLKSISKASGRIIYHCSDCQITSAADEIIHCKLTPEAQSRLKTKNYRLKVEKWFDSYSEEKDYHFSKFVKRLREIEKRKKTGKILDIGCATGFFLKIAQDHHWQVYGVDTEKIAIQRCRKILPKGKFFQGRLKKAQLPDSFFDVITLFETLEHVPDLREFLKETKRILKPQGLLIITVPNKAGFISKILGKNWFDYKRLQHLYFFTPNSLNAVLKSAYFEIIFLRKEVFSTWPMKNIVRKFKRYYPYSPLNRILSCLVKFTRFFGLRNAMIPLEHLYVIAQKK